MDKNTVMNDLLNFKANSNVFKIYADYFHINIFLVNLKQDKIYFTNNIFIPFKKNLFFLQIKENVFEPLFFNEKQFLQYNSDVIHKLTNTKNCVTSLLTGDEFSFKITEEQLDKYLVCKDSKMDYKDKILLKKMGAITVKSQPQEEKNVESDKYEEISGLSGDEMDEVDEVKEEDEENNKLKEEEKEHTPKYEKSELDRKKVNELKTIAEELKIDTKIVVNGKEKSKTKAQLISDILKA